MIRYGNKQNVWLQEDGMMDISRGAKHARVIETTTMNTSFNPEKSAIVAVDMQNFFLSEKLGRGPGGRAVIEPLIKAVRAGRSLGMEILWVNWGVRPDLANIPPSILRMFRKSNVYPGLGNELPDGLGPMLIKGSWSAELVPELEQERKESDVWVDKNRLSGFYGTDLDQILRSKGIDTLFFAGVNTDQCVLGTMSDANCLGYDSILLSDCTAATSPHGYESVLYNAERTGFVSTSSALERITGPERIQESGQQLSAGVRHRL